MIQTGIIGGAGYTAGELIRLLIQHKEVEISFIYSTSNAGNNIGTVHQDLAYSNLEFTSIIDPNVDVVFLCLGHGHSASFLENHQFSSHTRCIDLSNEFRLKNKTKSGQFDFIYGLPELQKTAIQETNAVANPGCFATAIQLALLPLAQEGLLQEDVHIHAITGATGAGRSLSETTHFTWRDNNFSHYKAFKHQHLDEMYQSIKSLQTGFDKTLHFLPHRGNFSRGIFATVYTQYGKAVNVVEKQYASYYEDHPFTTVLSSPLHLKQVVNTNHCFLHLEKHGDHLLITSIIDNLLKGASGQAVENMNLMFGFKQTEGLQLKANYF